MVHDRVIGEDLNNAVAEEEDKFGEVQQVTVRMLLHTEQLVVLLGRVEKLNGGSERILGLKYKLIII